MPITNVASRTISPRLFSGHWSIVLILTVAAILRFQNITQPFIDVYAWREASVAMMAENFYRRNWNILYPEVNWVGPGPGYQGREFQTVSYISALLYTFLGQHDWIGRSVSVLFGVLGIFATYQLTRRVWNEHSAIAAAALMAVLPGVVRLERSFLPDPAMVALIVTSFWMLLVYLQNDKPLYLIIAVVVGVWGVLTKISGMIVGLPLIYTIVSIYDRRASLSAEKIAKLGLVGILSALPVAAYYLWARHLAHSYPPNHFAGEGNWLWDQGLMQWIEQGYFISDLWGPLWRLWSAPVILLACFGMFLPFLLKKNDPETKSRITHASRLSLAPWLFHWWMAAGVVFYLIGARELVGNSSNFHILTPAVAALSANAIIYISSFTAKQLKRPALPMVIVVLIIVVIGIREWHYTRFYSTYAKQSYQLGLAMKALSREDDLVITLGDVIGCPVAIYYSGRRGWLFPPFGEIKDEERLPNETEAIATFERLRAKGAKWFGVVNRWRNDIWKERPKFAQYIEKNCELIKVGQAATICRIQSQDEHTANPFARAKSRLMVEGW